MNKRLRNKRRKQIRLFGLGLSGRLSRQRRGHVSFSKKRHGRVSVHYNNFYHF